MATPLSADRQLEALRAEGVKVSERPGWRSNNRNHKGPWGPTHGVMIHHTVSSGDDSSVALCYNGHSALPGPLCHGVGRNDGTIALVSAGRANHAGLGDDDVLRAVINETALPAPNEANTDGNRHFYGLEIVNLGDNKDTYTRAQYRAAVLWAAALCRAHGWSERSVIGHKEWQPGKIDPRGPIEGGGSFSMTQFRADVKAQLALEPGAEPPSEPTTPPKNDKPPAPAPVEDPMPAPTTLHESVAGGPDLPAGDWTELPAAEDTAIVRGPCTYDVGFSAVMSGTGDAGRVQLRFVHVDIETRRRSAALPVDVYVRGGGTGTQVSRRGFLPAGQYLKVEALADGAGAAVTHRTVDGLVWR
ncbi:N-acetylmuramoyl-L-alanine amidase [Streptomyces anulatus]|uniref:N-acetylmuramoyl-L-alanine amidase n=1 Tax=Streptomyces anulatus TaxID=1892 RepID=UPI00342AB9AF